MTATATAPGTTGLRPAQAFLRTLFAPYAPYARPDWTCEVRCLRTTADGREEVDQRWFGLAPEHLDLAAGHAEAMAADWNVYAGVLPRRGRRGDKGAVVAAAWLWAEIDKGGGTEDDVHALIRRARIAPAGIVVASGSGGGHLYYPLATPVSLEAPGAREWLQDLLSALVRRIGEQGGAHADPSCVNADRILRIPGTGNHKHDPPVMVTHRILEAEPRDADWWVRELRPFPSRLWGQKRPSPRAGEMKRSADMVTNGWIPPKVVEWARTPAAKGTRHREMARMTTFCIAEVRLPPDVVLELMQTKARCSPGPPPIDPAEVEKIVRSAARKYA